MITIAIMQFSMRISSVLWKNQITKIISNKLIFNINSLPSIVNNSHPHPQKLIYSKINLISKNINFILFYSHPNGITLFGISISEKYSIESLPSSWVLALPYSLLHKHKYSSPINPQSQHGFLESKTLKSSELSYSS